MPPKYLDRKNIKYFLFPDQTVSFAYPIIDINNDNDNKISEIKKIAKIATDILNILKTIFKEEYDNRILNLEDTNLYLIYYPPIEIDSFDDETKNRYEELWYQIGLFRYLWNSYNNRKKKNNVAMDMGLGERKLEDVRERGDESRNDELNEQNQLNINIVKRIFPGSPYLFYRWLIMKNTNTTDHNANIHFQFINHPLLYPTNKKYLYDNKNYVPLEDYYENMLIFTNPKTKSNPILNRRDKNYAATTYCGDDPRKWEDAYRLGRAGTYDKCLQLFMMQFPTSSIFNNIVAEPVIGPIRPIRSIVTPPLLIEPHDENKNEDQDQDNYIFPSSPISQAQAQAPNIQQETETEIQRERERKIELEMSEEKRRLLLDQLKDINLQNNAESQQIKRIRQQIKESAEKYNKTRQQLISLSNLPYFH